MELRPRLTGVIRIVGVGERLGDRVAEDLALAFGDQPESDARREELFVDRATPFPRLVRVDSRRGRRGRRNRSVMLVERAPERLASQSLRVRNVHGRGRLMISRGWHRIRTVAKVPLSTDERLLVRDS